MADRIRPFLEAGTSFDAEALSAMGEAFDRVKAQLHKNASRQIELYQVARLIIAQAREGEHDPDRLCNSVCATLGIQPAAATGSARSV